MLVWAIVGSGLLSLFLWKKANPGKSLNPTKEFEDNDTVAVNDPPRPRASAKP